MIEFPLEEVSAKTRSGPPADSRADYASPFWGGVVPLPTVAGASESDEAAVRARIAPPPYLGGEPADRAIAETRPRARLAHVAGIFRAPWRVDTARVLRYRAGPRSSRREGLP